MGGIILIYIVVAVLMIQLSNDPYEDWLLIAAWPIILAWVFLRDLTYRFRCKR